MGQEGIRFFRKNRVLGKEGVMKKALVLAVVVGILGFAAVATPAWDYYVQLLVEKAKAEGGVIFSYGMPETWANYGEIYGYFEELYGIVQHDIDMGSSVVLARMTEENATKNDVADLKPSLASVLASRGLTSDYQCSCWDVWPESQHGVDPNTGSVWQAAYWGTLGFLVNVDIVKPVPRTWKDLLNPAYKGLIGYLDPRATGTGVNTIEAAAYALSGDPYNYKAGVEFFKKLHDMGLIGSVDPLVTVARFQRGEIGILINFDYNLLKWKEDNPQINSVVIIPEDGTISSGGGVIMAKNAPHPWTARLFLEYLLCGEGQVLYAKAFVHPMNPTVKLPPEVLEKFPPKEAYDVAVFIDYKKDAEITDDLQEYYSKMIGGG
jgi:putative spermidine/putrescine transport system substrate-binding protein